MSIPECGVKSGMFLFSTKENLTEKDIKTFSFQGALSVLDH